MPAPRSLQYSQALLRSRPAPSKPYAITSISRGAAIIPGAFRHSHSSADHGGDRLYAAAHEADQAAGDPSQQKMMPFVPLMYLLFFRQASSGLVLYWLTGNIIGVAQQCFFNKTAGPLRRRKRLPGTAGRGLESQVFGAGNPVPGSSGFFDRLSPAASSIRTSPCKPAITATRILKTPTSS